MKTLNSLLLLPFLLGQLAAAEAREILTVAIFDFESREEVVRPLGPQIATLLNARLSAEPHLILVERAELDKALGEQELGLSGTVTGETAARVGQLTGAKVLITGRVFRVDRELLIVAKVIGTETSRVYGELVKGGASASIADPSAELADRLLHTLQEKGQTLVVIVPTRAQRLERIQQSLKRSDRPTVSVSIIERHFGVGGTGFRKIGATTVGWAGAGPNRIEVAPQAKCIRLGSISVRPARHACRVGVDFSRAPGSPQKSRGMARPAPARRVAG